MNGWVLGVNLSLSSLRAGVKTCLGFCLVGLEQQNLLSTNGQCFWPVTKSYNHLIEFSMVRTSCFGCQPNNVISWQCLMKEVQNRRKLLLISIPQ